MADELKTFDMVGKKEEVSDYISLIKPTDTPFLTSLSKPEKVEQTLYQWLEDDLREAAKNAKVEGHTFVNSERDQPEMRTNGTQILSETFEVTATNQAIKLYGRKNAVDRETMKTGKLLKMDLETSLVGTGQTYVVALPATPGEFAGVQAQIHADTTTDISVEFGETALNLSEDNVVDTHEKLYNAGSDGTVLMVRPSLTKTISGWAELSARARELSGDTKKITNVISVYESPFGTVRVVKNRRIRATDALIYSPDQWSLVVLRAWFREKLAKISDSDRWAMTGEYGLKHKNRKASAIITGIGVVNPDV